MEKQKKQTKKPPTKQKAPQNQTKKTQNKRAKTKPKPTQQQTKNPFASLI